VSQEPPPASATPAMPPSAPLPARLWHAAINAPQAGLLLVIVGLMTVLGVFAGGHLDRATGTTINNFLNSHTLIQTATDASFFAVMAVGATIVIISGGIDLSVGSIYALAGTAMALVLRGTGPHGPAATVFLGLGVCLGVGLLCGLANGLLVVGLKVHPFVITLGSMWVLRGIAFVTSHAESILVPDALTAVAKAPLGLGAALYPVPMVFMLAVKLSGEI
jgi:ribose/xylose/arabinose/galactoside ABC-type transport system permease subunit